MADLSIIIVNWNTRDLLLECLGALVLSSLNGYEVFVVDNASTDGSASAVRTDFSWVRLIECPNNLGFAAANNMAIRESSGRYILLLNPDTIVEKDALTRLWQVLSGVSSAGIVGAQLFNPDGSPQLSVGAFPSLWSEVPFINRRLSLAPRNTRDSVSGDISCLRSVDWVSGACLMIKRDVIERIGVLDENFWLYTEETDWCFRCKKAGWDVFLVPQAQVQHVARAASRQRFVETMLHFYRSRVRFVYKHRGRRQAEGIRTVLRIKSTIWGMRPRMSPLHQVYADLSDNEIRYAYRVLRKKLSLSLDEYLNGMAAVREN